MSQALGTGGHDLAEAIGGISMLHGLAALDGDPDTKVIVLVSKPPAEAVAAKVLAAAEASAKPVVVIFLGADPAAVTRNGVYGAAYLAQAADMAAALGRRRGHRAPSDITISDEVRNTLREKAAAMAPPSSTCAGSSPAARSATRPNWSTAARASPRTPTRRSTATRQLDDIARSVEHTIIDMGDDEFTQGRPHPMIDPSLRDSRIRDEIADPTTAVVLFDVVLGYGSAADPIAGPAAASSQAKHDGRRPSRFIGYVCGTDLDPQDREQVVSRLESAGVLVASSNAEAAAWSAALISRRGTRSPRMKTLFQQDLKVVNVGLQSFADNIAAAGGSATQLAWAPPAGADAALGWTLANLVGDPRIEEANRTAYDRYLAAQPRLVDLVLARDAIPALAASGASCTPGRRSPGRTCAARSGAPSPGRSSTRAGPTTSAARRAAGRRRCGGARALP